MRHGCEDTKNLHSMVHEYLLLWSLLLQSQSLRLLCSQGVSRNICYWLLLLLKQTQGGCPSLGWDFLLKAAPGTVLEMQHRRPDNLCCLCQQAVLCNAYPWYLKTQRHVPSPWLQNVGFDKANLAPMRHHNERLQITVLGYLSYSSLCLCRNSRSIRRWWGPLVCRRAAIRK